MIIRLCRTSRKKFFVTASNIYFQNVNKLYFQLTPDADFILDHHPYFENVVIAAGFSGHGFKMAPEVGRTLANMISGEEVEYDMSPFSIRRFDK